MSLHGRVAVSLLTLGGTLAASAAAQDPAGFRAEDHALGNLFGTREALSSVGITVDLDYTGEATLDLERDGGDYAHEVTGDLKVDLGHAVGWRGATVNLRIINRVGGDYATSERGATQQGQEIAGGAQPFRLLFLTLQQEFMDGAVDVLAGRTVMSGQFATTPIACAFQTLAVCGQPIGLPLGGAWQTYPAQAWGGRVRATLPGRFELMAGAYERNDAAFEESGFALSTRGQSGTAYPIELGYTVGGSLPGQVKIGYIYDTSDTQDVRPAGLAPWALTSREQGYLVFDQMILRTGEGAKGGVIVFGAATIAGEGQARVDRQLMGGVVAQGLVPARPKDHLGLVVSRVSYADGLTGPGDLAAVPLTQEVFGEANYGVQATPWLKLIPNVQHVSRPGGVAARENLWMMGLRIDLSL